MSQPSLIIADTVLRIDAYLAGTTGQSRSLIQRLLREGSITVNGKNVKPNYLLNPGDEIKMIYPKPRQTDVVPEEIPLDILYQDSDLAIINKPQGMVVHPSPGHASGTLVNGLLYAVKDLSGIGGELRPGIVHRIDRMTSGLLVVAKNDATHRALSDQFRDHSAHRSYIAIIMGNLKEDDGKVDAPIGRHPNDRKKMAVVDKGRAAITHWRVLKRFGEYTLLQLTLETGRTHQIRVHMAYQKHPLAGDEVYGCGKRQLGLEGQALHGYRLSFEHPGTGERMLFYAPVPTYFYNALCRAGETGSAETLDETLKTLDSTGKADES
ncbi:MAG: RluA family pseudouridine synthase [Clostridia bacterium]